MLTSNRPDGYSKAEELKSVAPDFTRFCGNYLVVVILICFNYLIVNEL